MFFFMKPQKTMIKIYASRFCPHANQAQQYPGRGDYKRSSMEEEEYSGRGGALRFSRLPAARLAKWGGGAGRGGGERGGGGVDEEEQEKVWGKRRRRRRRRKGRQRTRRNGFLRVNDRAPTPTES
jgi:hypothetical protein